MRAAVFLDRDGTLIEEVNYLRRAEQVRVLPGVPAALRALREAGYALVVVTNQSGVARGFFDEHDLQGIHQHMLACLEGVPLEGVYVCPHHPEHGERVRCGCRKPGTDLLERAARELDLDLSRSWSIGDKVSDLEGALRLGLRSILVRTGHGLAEEPRLPDGAGVADDLPAAARRILEEPWP